MGARWAWEARCQDCHHTFGGFSGGADPCPNCDSENVLETTLGGQYSPDREEILTDLLRAEHLHVSEHYAHDAAWCPVCQAIEGNFCGSET